MTAHRLSQVWGRLRGDPDLVECSTLFGKAEIFSAEPPVDTLFGALYLPISDEIGWGVFDADGKILGAAVNAYGDPPVAKQPVCDIEPKSFEWTSAGPFLYAGPINLHFGHFLLDVLSRLWSLKQFPGLKLLFHGPGLPADWCALPYVASIFKALDLNAADLVVLDRPTVIERLVIPHVSFREHAFAHRVAGELFHSIGARLRRVDAPTRGPLVYLSKSRISAGISGFENEEALDLALAKIGVEVLHPEALSLEEHVALFRKGHVVMGTVGSALHPSALVKGSRIVGLSPTPYLVSNFSMLDQLSGARSIYVHSPRNPRTQSTRFQLGYRLTDPSTTARSLASIGRRLLKAPFKPPPGSPDE